MGVTGGLLSLVTLRDRRVDTLWAAPRIAVRGVVTDSTTGAQIANARIEMGEVIGASALTDARGGFTLGDVVPGAYTIHIRTPSLDSVNAVHAVPVLVTGTATAARIRVPDAMQVGRAVCGSRLESPNAHRGMVFGRVARAGSDRGTANAVIVAEWLEADEPRWMEGRSDDRGNFRFCGVPIGRTIVLRATTDSIAAHPVATPIGPTRRFARAELTLDPDLPATASLVGVVVADTLAMRPIEGAEIAIAAIDKSVRSDARGRFRLRDIPPGTHQVVVRKPGFGVAAAPLAFGVNSMVERRVVLTAMTTLDEVLVTAERIDPRLRLFDENRRLGLGQFLTRDALARHEGGARRLGDVLRDMKSVDVYSQGSRAWVSTSRGVRSLVRNCTPLDGARQEGGRLTGGVDCSGCYPVVFVDRTIVYHGRQGEAAPNINQFAPQDVEAIELYASPSQVPAEYSGLNTHCGVLVIHTRR
jgi:hypothetical protein